MHQIKHWTRSGYDVGPNGYIAYVQRSVELILQNNIDAIEDGVQQSLEKFPQEKEMLYLFDDRCLTICHRSAPQ